MNEDELKESLSQYKSQLEQIEETLKVTAEGEEHDSLNTLKNDIQQLIDLTSESLKTLVDKKVAEKEPESQKNEEKEEKTEDPLKDEYDLFMSEMSETGAFEKNDKTPDDKGTKSKILDIEEELSAMEGMKCLVPYDHTFGGSTTFHHAMVCSVIREEINENSGFNDIRVRILFTNPTHVEMIPCPFYLGGECKFSSDQCRFSHGEIVPLSTLTEAEEPNFSQLKSGSRVLVKLKPMDEPGSSRSVEKYLLWHRAIVSHVDLKDHKCEVKLERRVSIKNGGSNHHVVDFDHILPLEGSTEDCSDTDLDSSDLDDIAENEKSAPESKLVDQALLNGSQSVKLGDWEKHTKGIGSKLMISMGYVVGNGLGPEGQGKVEPVCCRPTPSGKSLDHYMELKELIKNTGDPLKAEKRMKRLQKRKEEREKKAYEREQEKEKHDVFNIINNVLSTKKETKKEESSNVKSTSCKDLNIEQFKIEEEMKRVDKDIEKLKSSLSRSEKGSALFMGIKEKLDAKTQERDSLKSRQRDITKEQGSRKDKKSMSVF